MANQRKSTKTSAKKVTKRSPVSKSKTARSTSSRSARVRKTHKMPARQYELIMFIIMGLSVLLAIAIYFNSKAMLLRGLRHFIFGSFGISAYLIPVFIFVSALFKLANQGNDRLDNKIKLGCLILVDISIIAHIFYVLQPQIHLKINDARMFPQVLANYYRVSGNYHVAGGFLGGLFGDLLLIPLGKWGTFVLALVLLVVFVVLFTEVSITQIIGMAQMLFINIYNWIKLKIAQIQEKRAEREKKEKLSSQEKDWDQLIIEKELAERNQENSEGVLQNKNPSPKPKRKISFLNIDLKVKDHEEMEAISKNSVDSEVVSDLTKEEIKAENMTSPEKQENGVENSSVETRTNSESNRKMNQEAVQVSSNKATTKQDKVKIMEEQKAIQEEIKIEKDLQAYSFPPIELLKQPLNDISDQSQLIEKNARKLEETLKSFGVSAKVINVSQGPTVTRYEIQPAQGVKVSRIVGLSDDIALNLAAAGIRMEAPIPGKSAIGIEVPNREAGSVMLREVLDSPEFKKLATKLSFGLGKDITGRALVTDIAKMPHLLIAGATGSGKSVCINTLIVSLLYKAKPEEVRLLMIDPKVVELSVYNGIPHLLIPVVTDPKKAAGALNWAVQEMNDRYKLFAATGVRDLKGYNAIVEAKGDTPKLPQIVIIVDELADLMMAASNDVEEAIVRLAQMARAAGLHLIIATQRPSVDVITGLIKANIPSRIAFNVSSGTDSRTIIDMNGAEKLLGKGDMLFYPVGYPKPVRIQGAFISDHEVENIVDYLKTQHQTQYNQKIMNHLNKTEETATGEVKDDLDEFFADALELVVDKERASASMIQRQFRVGFNRAARIVDQLAEAGYVGEEQGSKARDVLITRRELEQLKSKAKQGSETTTDPEVNSTLESNNQEHSNSAENSNEQAEDMPVNDAINDLVDEINQKD